jgi:hypothetical protein
VIGTFIGQEFVEFVEKRSVTKDTVNKHTVIRCARVQVEKIFAEHASVDGLRCFSDASLSRTAPLRRPESSLSGKHGG